MAQEIVFESLQLKFESTRGTAGGANPSNRLNMAGTITPQITLARPTANLGLLAELAGTEVARTWATIEGEGPMDTLKAPLIAAMVFDGSVTAGTIVSGASYKWNFSRKLDADNLK